MYLIDPKGHTRRAFLRRTGQLAIAGTAAPFALNLASMGEAAAAAAGDDYKALVCVFLYGGNDYANTLVTYDDPSHAAYTTIRGAQAAGGVAIAKADLAPTLLTPTTALAGGRQYALNPAMTELATLFNTDGRMAVQMNVGPLVVPLNRALFNNSNKKLYPQPPKLFSHNDQQSTWQSSSPEGSTVGWGGNIGDLILQQNQNSNSLFTCISVSGNAVFLSGDSALQYQVGTGGAVRINSITNGGNGFVTPSVRSLMADLAQQARGHMLENEYNRVTQRAVQAEGTMGLVDFHRYLASQGIADKVTTFTASDFGRTLASNGDGSDHGWGSHHFVVGGAVKGKELYGTAPVVSINNPANQPGYDGHVGQGRLIPTTSVDQYAATLAKWFGVPDADLPSILPNITHFGGSLDGINYPRDVGFML
jgi:uncharacterized protein (DUF1501 family)